MRDRGKDQAPLAFIGAFESTFLPAHDVDVAETTEHVKRFSDDVALLQSCGVESLRYPIRWHRVEPEPGVFDWSSADATLNHLHDLGLNPIVDLVHHTSYPAWMQGFGDNRFHDSYLRFAEGVARRYPWIRDYTLFNEPFATLFLCGHEAIWPPYEKSLESFLSLVQNVMPAVVEASGMYGDLLPGGRHFYVDSCERHTAGNESGEGLCRLANDRRFFVADLFLGQGLDPSRPFVSAVSDAGFDDLLSMEPGSIDVLGLDYYAHCQWEFTAPDAGRVPASEPLPLADQITEYWQRYGLPCILGETNIRGAPSDRASWFKYTVEQCEKARARGVPLEGYCWFPFIDSVDWDSLLFYSHGNIDPVGVYSLDEDFDRREGSMARSFRAAVAGTPAAALPAYEFQEPVAGWLQGFRPEMEHWDWEPPPADEIVEHEVPSDLRIELKIRDPATPGPDASNR